MKDITYYLTFGKRYLLLVISCCISAVYIALNINLYNLTYSIGKIIIYSALFITVCTMLACAAAFAMRKNRRALRLIIYALLMICVIVFSFVAALYRRSSMNAAQEFLEKQKVLYCRVISEPKPSSSENSSGFTADVYKTAADEKITSFSEPCRIFIYSENSESAYLPSIGDFIIVTRPRSMTENNRPSFKGGFDYNRYLRQSDIVYSCYSPSTKQAKASDVKSDRLSLLDSIGSKVRTLILDSTNSYNYESAERALLSGILMGDKSEFSKEGYSKLSKSGFMHIAAVSGMHVSYLLLFITSLLSVFKLPKRLSAAITVPCLVIFAFAAQLTPSVSRAVFMMSVFLLSNILRRSSDSLTAIGIAALTLVISNPYYLENASFLLSFGAAIGILVFYKPLHRIVPSFKTNDDEPDKKELILLSHKEQLKRMLKKTFQKSVNFVSSSVCLSISASLGTIYFMAKIFGGFQWGSIIGNILVVPLTGIIFISGTANAVIAAVFPALSNFVGTVIINPALKLMNLCIKLFSSPTFSISMPTPQPSFFIIYLIICIGIYAILIPPRRQQRNIGE